MKNSSLWSRSKRSIAGLRTAWEREQSFRTQTMLVAVAIAVVLYVQPEPIWMALFLLSVTIAASAELANAALEALADRLHPQHHAEIGAAKDMASAAAFVSNCCTAMLFAWIVSGRLGG